MDYLLRNENKGVFMIQSGYRVALVLKNDIKSETEKICYFLGYASCIGQIIVTNKDLLVQKNWNNKSKRWYKARLPDKPYWAFKKEDGEIFYEFECWFMLEERFRKAFIEDEYKEGWKVINVDRNGKEI